MTRRPQDQTAKDMALPLKQQWIADELERLRAETEPVARELPGEVQKIVRCIHEHLFDPDLRVKEICSRCRIRNHNASTRFRLAVGVGIREYIEALRLDIARRLLEQDRVEIYLIAMAVGYACQETFCRAFSRRFGRTASSCR